MLWYFLYCYIADTGLLALCLRPMYWMLAVKGLAILNFYRILVVCQKGEKSYCKHSTAISLLILLLNLCICYLSHQNNY